MWIPITSLETETFYKSITIVMKKSLFYSTMIIPVIKYIMDYISDTFVYWFKKKFCFILYFVLFLQLLRSCQTKYLNLSHLRCVSLQPLGHHFRFQSRQRRAASGLEDSTVSCSVSMLPLAGEGKAGFGFILYLPCLFSKITFLESSYLRKNSTEECFLVRRP